MGVIISSDEQKNCLARFDNGNVYSGHGGRALGAYAFGKVYDIDGKFVASYEAGILKSEENNKNEFTVDGCFICCNNEKIAQFQGNAEEACIAAFLYYRSQPIKNDKVEGVPGSVNKFKPTEYWSFQELVDNVLNKSSTLVKIIVVALLVLIGYQIWQIPSLITLLMEVDIGIILLLSWGVAFLFGFQRNTYPRFFKMSHVISLLWELLVPYLHAAWVSTVVICVYLGLKGYLAYMELSAIIYALCMIVIPLSAPFYAFHLVRLLRLLYKNKP